jgi:hypothetical protein
MNYVEWLRVRNCLRCVIIILAIFVALGVILRVSVNRYMSSEAWIAHMSMENGAKETQTTLPDGTKRLTINDPDEQTRIVVDDHGYAGRHIVITEPSSRAHKEHDDVSFGSLRVVKSHHGGVTTTVIDTNGAVPMIYYMALADLVALIVATVLAAALAREIDGHLEVALTKPCSRLRYALGVVGVDVVGILAASVLTVIAFYLCQLLFESPRLDFSGVNMRAVAMGIAMPLAWYAMLCAATTWLHRSWVAVLAFAWPAVALVGILTLLPMTSPVALFVHDVAWGLSRLIPLSYVQMASPDHMGSTISYTGDHFGMRISLVTLFFVVYGALAVWQWQRVEA